MKVDLLGRPTTGPEKLKQKRLMQQIPIMLYIKQELTDYQNKKIDKISTNAEIAKKFGITNRKLQHYLTDYQKDTEQVLSKEELKIRKHYILQQMSVGDKNPFYGKKHSEETKLKIKIARQNRPLKELSCKRCNKKFLTKNYNKWYCSDCKVIIRRERMREIDRRRRDNPRRRRQLLIAQRKYCHSEKGRTTKNSWRRNTEKGRLNTIFNNLKRRERLAKVIRKYTKKEWFEKVKSAKEIGVCPICKHPFTEEARSRHQLTMHHNPPLSKAPKGFVYTINNIEPICFSCNAKKQDRE